MVSRAPMGPRRPSTLPARWLVLATALATWACGTPTPQLQLSLAGPPSQKCPSTDCGEVPLLCGAVMSIRILDPEDPSAPYLSQCVEVPVNTDQDMCSLRSVTLEPTAIPVRDLEVQVAVYPASAIPRDPETRELHCPTNVAYTRDTGYPVEQAPTPALGGRAYYHPGDSVVAVTLGCTDRAAINEDSTCARPSVAVSAMVYDFDMPFPVGDLEADRLRVWVGEPHAEAGGIVLREEDEWPLRRDPTGGFPSWSALVDLELAKYACIEVAESGVLTVASVHCKLRSEVPELQLSGIRIAKKTLDGVLSALSSPGFPSQGLTVGIVVDDEKKPVPGVTVSASNRAKVSYLEAPGILGGNATSHLGIFVALDAPFGTTFSSSGAFTSRSAVGGMIADKVTLVVLTPPEPSL